MRNVVFSGAGLLLAWSSCQAAEMNFRVTYPDQEVKEFTISEESKPLPTGLKEWNCLMRTLPGNTIPGLFGQLVCQRKGTQGMIINQLSCVAPILESQKNNFEALQVRMFFLYGKKNDQVTRIQMSCAF